jgi:phage nucleotide-binding protein
MIMEFKKIKQGMSAPYTALLYCAPGVGKSTAIGVISEKSKGNTLVLDVDRTIQRTLAKGEIVKNTDKVIIAEVDNRSRIEKDGVEVSPGTFKAWTELLQQITPEFLKEHNITTVAVDNISELERCILSDLGSQGKNKGVPAMADYQYMQFKLVNSLRYMKSWGVNIVWTAWEDIRAITYSDGSQISQLVPKISAKIVDNICGLCDVVGRIMVNKDGAHGIILEATQNIYAKNQIDSRKGCLVEEFINFTIKEESKK